jgi:hypothetical protein
MDEHESRVEMVLHPHSAISLLDLSDLLGGLNEAAVRACLSWLRSAATAGSARTGMTREQAMDALSRAGSSFIAFGRRKHITHLDHPGAAWAIFDDDLDAELFASWVRSSLRDFALTVREIREGNSIIFTLALQSVAALAGTPLDYSLANDLARFWLTWLKGVLTEPRAQDTLSSSPKDLERAIVSIGSLEYVSHATIRMDGIEVELNFDRRKHNR